MARRFRSIRPVIKIIAAWESECDQCFKPVFEGDTIGKRDGDEDWLCEACVDEPE